MAKKANTEKLNGLHDLIATYYRGAIQDALDDNQELSSGTLAAINAFLKNNNITADIVESDPVQNLTFNLNKILKEQQEG